MRFGLFLHGLALAGLVVVGGACAGSANPPAKPQAEVNSRLTIRLLEVREGQSPSDQLRFATQPKGSQIPLLAADFYDASHAPNNGVRLVLGFQLAEGKTREDFLKFKDLDLEWVKRNNGATFATYYTERTADWPFDAFEDAVFATYEDFETAYAGSPELNAAARGLFGDQVLVAIVDERSGM